MSHHINASAARGAGKVACKLCVWTAASGVRFGLLVEMCTRQTCRAPSHWIARAETPGSDLLPPRSLAEPDALAGSRRIYLSTANRLTEACAESSTV